MPGPIIATAGRILDRIEEIRDTPVLADQAGIVFRILARRRAANQPDPTEAELRTEMAAEVAQSPASQSNINVEEDAQSRVIQGNKMSLQAWGAFFAAVVLAWQTKQWDNLINQILIALPFILAIVGNVLSLFGRKAENPVAFRLLNIRTWFARN